MKDFKVLATERYSVRKFDTRQVEQEKVDMGVVDASIVGSHIMFTVADIGLGTTWIAHFDPTKVRKAYNLPDNIIPVAIFPIGYPHPDCVPAPGHTKRFDVSEFTIYNSF